MTPKANAYLEQIKGQLQTAFRELGIGEYAAIDEDADEDERQATDDADPASAGELDADNPTDIIDSFEEYIGSIADALLDDYEMDDDEAYDIIFDLADGLAEDGDLMEIPEDDDEQALAMWLGQAKTIGFANIVLANVEDWAEEE